VGSRDELASQPTHLRQRVAMSPGHDEMAKNPKVAGEMRGDKTVLGSQCL